MCGKLGFFCVFFTLENALDDILSLCLRKEAKLHLNKLHIFMLLHHWEFVFWGTCVSFKEMFLSLWLKCEKHGVETSQMAFSDFHL